MLKNERGTQMEKIGSTKIQFKSGTEMGDAIVILNGEGMNGLHVNEALTQEFADEETRDQAAVILLCNVEEDAWIEYEERRDKINAEYQRQLRKAKEDHTARCCVVCGYFGPAMFVRGFCDVLRKNVYDDEVCPNFKGHRSRATTGGAIEQEEVTQQ